MKYSVNRRIGGVSNKNHHISVELMFHLRKEASRFLSLCFSDEFLFLRILSLFLTFIDEKRKEKEFQFNFFFYFLVYILSLDCIL